MIPLIGFLFEAISVFTLKLSPTPSVSTQGSSAKLSLSSWKADCWRRPSRSLRKTKTSAENHRKPPLLQLEAAPLLPCHKAFKTTSRTSAVVFLLAEDLMNILEQSNHTTIDVRKNATMRCHKLTVVLRFIFLYVFSALQDRPPLMTNLLRETAAEFLDASLLWRDDQGRHSADLSMLSWKGSSLPMIQNDGQVLISWSICC